MGMLNNLVNKLAKTASVAATESVKAEVKTVASNALPTLVGIGFAIAGLVIFRSSLTKGSKVVSEGIIPMVSRTSMVTNNWFLGCGKEAQEEILKKIINQ